MTRIKDIISQEKYLIVKSGASWCGPCKSEAFKSDYAKLKKSAKKYKFVEIDVDNNQDDTEYLKVKSIPDIKLYKEGVLKKQYDGKDAAKKMLEYLESK